MVLTEGWDMPEVRLLHPGAADQKDGPVPADGRPRAAAGDGKTDAIVLDHSGAVFRHGFVEDHVEWTLDPDQRATVTDASPKRAEAHASRLLECTQCGAIRVAGEPCSHCGFLPQRPPRDDRHSLTAISAWSIGDRRAKADIYDPAVRAHWHAMLALHRRRARLQARLGRAQVQGKIRRLAAVGRIAAADPADARSPQLGALAHDRLCQGKAIGMSKTEIMRRLRFGDLRKILRFRYGHTLPDDDAGREDLFELLLPVSVGRESGRKMQNVIEIWAPWMDAAEAGQLIDRINRTPISLRKLSARALGRRLRATNAERERLKLRTIKPFNMTDKQLAGQRRAKERSRARRRRQKKGSKTRAAYIAAALTTQKPWKTEGYQPRFMVSAPEKTR